MPKISVVIPVYNGEKTILETIESVQKQTFSDFEVIVINDGSTDKTLELIQSVKDQRLKIFSYQNGGLSVARNRGIERATGEFIAFLDADDLWTPDKLELQLAALQQCPEAGVVYSWTRYIDEQGKSFYAGRRIFFEGNVLANLLLTNFLLSGSNPLIRKQAIEAVGGFDSTLAPVADWDFYLRLAASWPFVVVPKYQILYRKSSISMSAKVDVMKEEGLSVLEKAFRAAPPELQSLRSQSLSIFHKYCTNLYLQHSTDITGVSKAGQNLWMTIRLQPQSLLERDTQRLALKFMIRRVLPPRVARYLIQVFRKTGTIRELKFQK